MMKCSNCGTENPEGMKFCGSCGKELLSISEISRIKFDEHIMRIDKRVSFLYFYTIIITVILVCTLVLFLF